MMGGALQNTTQTTSHYPHAKHVHSNGKMLTENLSLKLLEQEHKSDLLTTVGLTEII